MKRLGLTPAATLGFFLVAGFVLVALFGPWLAPYSPITSDLDNRFLGPSLAHPFGTDANGTDLFSQMLYGARLALFISGTVVTISAIFGTALGIACGYFRGWLDEIVMRVVDVLLSFPGILLNIAIVALVARPGVMTLICALAIVEWTNYARLARGQVLSLRERDFVHAARAIGAGPFRIMFRYLAPNIASLILIKMSFAFGSVMLIETSLSFLGLGPQVPYTWGSLLDQAQTYLWVTPRLALFPGIAIMLIVLGSNLLGDGLRDRFDPKRKVTD